MIFFFLVIFLKEFKDFFFSKLLKVCCSFVLRFVEVLVLVLGVIIERDVGLRFVEDLWMVVL